MKVSQRLGLEFYITDNLILCSPGTSYNNGSIDKTVDDFCVRTCNLWITVSWLLADLHLTSCIYSPSYTCGFMQQRTLTTLYGLQTVLEINLKCCPYYRIIESFTEFSEFWYVLGPLVFYFNLHLQKLFSKFLKSQFWLQYFKGI